MKIVAIADLQGLCDSLKTEMFPPADMLIIAGDLTSWGHISELAVFDDWIGTLQYRYKHIVYVAGNHDRGLYRDINGRTFFKNGTYLQDSHVTIDNQTIWGTPASDCGPYAANWVFCDKSYIERSYNNIPNNVDILISHGPPHGILDVALSGEHIGSKHLLGAIDRVKPRLVITGHCHESFGTAWRNNTLIVNAALCDVDNNILDIDNVLLRQPITIDL